MDETGSGARPEMSAEQARIAELERRLAQLEWRERATERGRAIASSIIPEETRGHLRAAWREQLLAARSLIDHWARRLDDDGDPPRREEIKID